ncbi:MAG: hypothetical protein R3B81_05845 [bacterium]
MRLASVGSRPSRSIAALVLALGLLASGCAVRYLAEYDPRLEDGAITLQREMDYHLTELEIADADSARTYAESREFYAQYAVELRSLQVRARAQALNELTSEQIDLVLANLEEMRAQHEKDNVLSRGFLTTSRELFNTQWESVLKLETAKRRGGEEK